MLYELGKPKPVWLQKQKCISADGILHADGRFEKDGVYEYIQIPNQMDAIREVCSDNPNVALVGFDYVPDWCVGKILYLPYRSRYLCNGAIIFPIFESELDLVESLNYRWDRCLHIPYHANIVVFESKGSVNYSRCFDDYTHVWVYDFDSDYGYCEYVIGGGRET